MTVYAEPRDVRDVRECHFYHSMVLPGHGEVTGDWDLREGFDQYIGHVDVRGKRVLDVGTASGFVGFSLESRGASVVAYDLPPYEPGDIVPFDGAVDEIFERERRLRSERVNNAFWYAHRALQSSVRLVHGTVYAVSREIGPVDIAVMGCILLHLRDPFLALQNVLTLTKETVVVVDLVPPGYNSRMTGPTSPVPQWFVPEPGREQRDTWWALSPELVVRVLGVLGFRTSEVFFHNQPGAAGPEALFTVVGRRASPRGGNGLVQRQP
jgi:hypothetical protein